MDDYLAIYLFGVFVTGALLVIRNAMRLVVGLFTGSAIRRKNMAKLGVYFDYVSGELTEEPQSIKTLFSARFIFLQVFGLSTSWIGAALETWMIGKLLLSLPRIVFTRTPSRIAELEYPLKTTTDIPAESVFARGFALSVLTGVGPASLDRLEAELQLVLNRVPTFKRDTSIEFLRQLSLPELAPLFETEGQSKVANLK